MKHLSLPHRNLIYHHFSTEIWLRSMASAILLLSTLQLVNCTYFYFHLSVSEHSHLKTMSYLLRLFHRLLFFWCCSMIPTVQTHLEIFNCYAQVPGMLTFRFLIIHTLYSICSVYCLTTQLLFQHYYAFPFSLLCVYAFQNFYIHCHTLIPLTFLFLCQI